MNILDRMRDLQHRALHERSHYYVADTLSIAMTEIKNLRDSSNLVECKLWEVDLYENWMKVKVPQQIMDRGFHAGTVLIDFKGVQE